MIAVPPAADSLRFRDRGMAGRRPCRRLPGWNLVAAGNRSADKPPSSTTAPPRRRGPRRTCRCFQERQRQFVERLEVERFGGRPSPSSRPDNDRDPAFSSLWRRSRAGGERNMPATPRTYGKPARDYRVNATALAFVVAAGAPEDLRAELSDRRRARAGGRDFYGSEQIVSGPPHDRRERRSLPGRYKI